MRRLVGFLLGAASLLMGGASLHILIPMCLKILYAFCFLGVRGGGAFCGCALVPSRISVMTPDSSAETFLSRAFRPPAPHFVELSAVHLAHSLRENATKC